MVGMSIALMASSILTLGLVQSNMGAANVAKGTLIGNQLSTINTGLASYINANSTAIIAGTAVTGVVKSNSPTIPELQALGFINSGVLATPTYGGSYNILASVTPTGCTSGCQVIGKVWLSNPIYTSENKPADIKLLGAAVTSSSTNSIGFSLPNTPTAINGSGWTVTNPDPKQQAGILLATTNFKSAALYWLQSATNFASLPTSGNTLGDGRLARDTNKPYSWNGTAWQELFGNKEAAHVSLGHQSGASNLTAVGNVFIGYGSGFSSPTGANNTFTGRASGGLSTTGASNVFNGAFSGYGNTTGNGNIFSGFQAGISNTTGSYNVISGYNSGNANNSDGNVFVGAMSGASNTTGSGNVFTGYQSGMSNTTAAGNTFTGYLTGYLSTGAQNVFNGAFAGASNTTGSGNIFNGYSAGLRNTTGSQNIFTGSQAGLSNTTAAMNVFTGTVAGYANTTGGSNVFIGHAAGYANTVGSANIFIGRDAGGGGTTSSSNVFIGNQAGYNNTAFGNVFIGNQAGMSSTSGGSNLFSGYYAGYSNTTGGGNVFTGYQAGMSNTTGIFNVFTGKQAGYSNTTGVNNVFTGQGAGYANTSGGSNLFSGNQTGQSNTTGMGNVFTGELAGSQNTTGWWSVFSGYYAGYSNTTGGYNTTYGAKADLGAGTLNNASAFGYSAIATTSNSVRLGNTAVTLIGGQVAWSNLSDRRLKTNIKDSTRGLAFVNKLRPVDYILKDNKKPETGFIAQEVEEVDPNFEGINKPKEGEKYYSLTYTDFIPSMVKSIQEIDAKLEQLPAQKESHNQKRIGLLEFACILLGALLLLSIGFSVYIFKRLNNLQKKVDAHFTAVAQTTTC